MTRSLLRRFSVLGLVACALVLVVASTSILRANAPTPIEVGKDVDRRDITTSGDLYEGRGDNLQIETAIGADGATGRMSVRAATQGTNPNWFVFALRNSTDKPVERMLVAERYEHAGSGIIWPNLDARRVDNVTPSLGFVPERMPFDNADAFRLTIEPGQTVTFAAELVGDRVPRLQLWRSVDYEKRVRNRQLFHGIMLGVVGLLALFLSSIFLVNHQAIFPAAALFAWMVLAYLCVDFGFFHKLFAIRPEESAIYRAAGEAGMSAAMLLFSYTFLRIGRWHGFIRMLAGLAIASQLALFALAFLDPRLAATFARLSLAGVLVLSALVTLYLGVRGQDRALAVLPTWILFGVWLFAAALMTSGRLSSEVIVNGVVAGLVLLVVLIGFTVTQFAFRSTAPAFGGSPDDQQTRALAMEATGAALFEWSARRDEVRVGPLVDATLGLPAAERRETLPRFAERVHAADREKLTQGLSALKGRGGQIRLDFRMQHVDGSDRWFTLEGGAVPSKQDQRNARCVGLVRDITDQRREMERLLQNAVRDGSTFLPNKGLVLDRLDVGLARAKAEPAIQPTVFYIDVDRTQSVSAAHVGEAVIVSIARKFQRLAKPGDVVGRLGADQFALVMMQKLDEREQRLIAEDLRNAIKTGMNIAGQEIMLTGSIGIATLDPQAPPPRPADLVNDAEVAMQRARRAGPDRIETFTAAMRADKDQRSSMERDLLAAIERKQVQVLFQPIQYLRTGMLAGFEAVARWDHPKLGLLDPAEFTPLEDASPFTAKLGGYLVRAAADEAKRWHEEHPRPEAPIFVAVNVSRRQLFGEDLVRQVRAVMARGDLPKGALRLDVSEALVLDNPEAATALLKELTQAGARVSLDEFGAGYSSFSFLGAFAFDSIKIDAAYVHGAAIDGRGGTALLRSLVALAHELGKSVVARGADEEADFGLLRSVGCDFAQGSASAGRFVAAREAMALVRHLRKTERRLKRSGLFRLRNRRIEDDAEAVEAAMPRAVSIATVPPAQQPSAAMSAKSQPGASPQASSAAQPSSRVPETAPETAREPVRVAAQPSRSTTPMPAAALPHQASREAALSTLRDTLRTTIRPRPPTQPAAAEAGPPASARAHAPPPNSPPPPPLAQTPAPSATHGMSQHAGQGAAPMTSPGPALSQTTAQPTAQAVGHSASTRGPQPPAVPVRAPAPVDAPTPAAPMSASTVMPPPLPAAAPAPGRPVAQPPPLPSIDQPAMVDRTLARLQAEIARSTSDLPGEPRAKPAAAAAATAVPMPPPPAPPGPPPIPAVATIAPARVMEPGQLDTSALPPALADSLARLAGRKKEVAGGKG